MKPAAWKGKATLDPTGYYVEKGFGLSDVANACGYIPNFLATLDPNETVQECFNRTYAHGGGWQNFADGAKYVDRSTGIFRYPEDPPQYPYVKFTDMNGQDVYIYPHGNVAIVTGESVEFCRMD